MKKSSPQPGDILSDNNSFGIKFANIPSGLLKYERLIIEELLYAGSAIFEKMLEAEGYDDDVIATIWIGPKHKDILCTNHPMDGPLKDAEIFPDKRDQEEPNG
jgi:hypothetical protein